MTICYNFLVAYIKEVQQVSGSLSSTFFMATGFHGFHVLVGTIFLIVVLFRALAGHFKPDQHFGFEAVWNQAFWI